MIKLSNVETSDSGQLWMVTHIDAKAADIHVRRDAATAENELSKRLVALSNAVNSSRDTDMIEQDMREYMREVLFRHYVDVLSINDYIYDARQAFIQYKQNVILAGFNMMYKYYGEVEEND